MNKFKTLLAAGLFIAGAIGSAFAEVRITNIAWVEVQSDINLRDVNLRLPAYLRNDFDKGRTVGEVEWSFTDVTVPNRPVLVTCKYTLDTAAINHFEVREFQDKGTLEVTQVDKGVVIKETFEHSGMGNLLHSSHYSGRRNYFLHFGVKLKPLNGLPERFAQFLVPIFPLNAGDVNEDQVVNLIDLNIVRNNFGTNSQNGDANYDGSVNLLDLNLVRSQLGIAAR
jgi:hypothetical protein